MLLTVDWLSSSSCLNITNGRWIITLKNFCQCRVKENNVVCDIIIITKYIKALLTLRLAVSKRSFNGVRVGTKRKNWSSHSHTKAAHQKGDYAHFFICRYVYRTFQYRTETVSNSCTSWNDSFTGITGFYQHLLSLPYHLKLYLKHSFTNMH